MMSFLVFCPSNGFVNVMPAVLPLFLLQRDSYINSLTGETCGGVRQQFYGKVWQLQPQ
jgi:hypothetical protein